MDVSFLRCKDQPESEGARLRRHFLVVHAFQLHERGIPTASSVALHCGRSSQGLSLICIDTSKHVCFARVLASWTAFVQRPHTQVR